MCHHLVVCVVLKPPGAFASIPSKCPAVLLHRVNTDNWRPSNKLRGGPKSWFTSRRLQKGVISSQRSTFALRGQETEGRLREGHSSSCRQRRRGSVALAGPRRPERSVTFTLLCSRDESSATRSLTMPLMVPASRLLMSSPLLSCCQKQRGR